jgi:hypothetical protein
MTQRPSASPLAGLHVRLAAGRHVRLLFGAAVLVAGASVALAQTTPGPAGGVQQKPLVIFVGDVMTDAKQTPPLTSEAAALTSELCGALGRDKRVEVLCAPDIRQLLDFAATQAMLGGNPAADRIAARAEAADGMVQTRLHREGGALVLVLEAGPLLEGSSLTGMGLAKALVRLENKAATNQGLVARLPDVSARIVAGLVAPVAQQAPPPPPPPTLQ